MKKGRSASADPVYISGKTFSNNAADRDRLVWGEYEDCTFRNCDLSSRDLSEWKFISCSFIDCDLSNAVLRDTAFREVTFEGCRMIGLRFEDCNGFGLTFNFRNCSLYGAAFYKLQIPSTIFLSSDLREADLSGCGLKGSSFEDTDLQGAVFDDTDLEDCDLSSAVNFIIDPERNRLKGALFSVYGLPGLLDRHGIVIR